MYGWILLISVSIIGFSILRQIIKWSNEDVEISDEEAPWEYWHRQEIIKAQRR